MRKPPEGWPQISSALFYDDSAAAIYGDDYGSDRTYRCEDLEGHQWWFMQRLRGPKPKA